jgi:hypothetical protein
MNSQHVPELASLEHQIEFGAPFRNFFDDPDPQAYGAAVRNWIQACIASPRPNAVFMDTTTIQTALSLLKGDRQILTPMTLLDLANVTSALIVNDNIFHLENSDLDSPSFNDLLHDRAFIPLPVSAKAGAVGSFALSHWRQSRLYLNRVAQADPELSEDARAIKEAWEAILGPGTNWSHWHDDQISFSNRVYGEESRPREFLSNVTELFNRGAMAGARPDAGRVGDFVNECNLRSLFNWSVAYALKLPYVANSFRLPFQQFLYARGEATRQHLVRFLDEKYREQARAFGAIEHRVRVPLFLAAILAKASSLANVVERLQEFRSKAASFRSRKAELEAAIRREDLKASKELMRSLEVEEGPKLMQYAISAGGVILLGYIGAAVHQLHPDPMHALLISGELLGGGLFVKFAEDRLLHPLFSPRLRLISTTVDYASQSMSIGEKVASIWNTKLSSNFAPIAERLALLKY